MLNKIKQLKADGISKIHIIADFDRTLTVSTTKSGKANSCYAILREEKYLSSDYPEKAHALFDKYYPYEISQDITEQERDEKMNEWFNEHFHLFKQSGLTKSVFKDIILKKHIQLRDGARELLELSNQHNVPLLIFSAGMGNLIQEFLEDEGLLFPNIHIIANFYNFDQHGHLTSPKNKFIHAFNKNEFSIKNTPYHQTIQQRHNVILIGDSLGDANMSEGLNHKIELKIGLCNTETELLKKYKELFDIVIENDGPLTRVNDLLRVLSS